jgi:chloride channel protein, CIC family
MTGPKPDIKAANSPGSLLALALLAPVVGAGAGLIGAIFRLALEHADDWRNALIAHARGDQFAGFLLVTVVSSAAVAIAAWLVNRFAPAA